VSCWGLDDFGQAKPLPGSFAAISAGATHTCGLRATGDIACWGSNSAREATPPGGPFAALSAGSAFTCGLRLNGSVVCWGSNDHGRASPPPGQFLRISAKGRHGCGITTDSRVLCWGDNENGESRPPGPPIPDVKIALEGCSPCRAGDVAKITLNFANPGPERTLELKAVAHFPDGVTVVQLVSPHGEFVVPPGDSILEFDDITLSEDLPLGTHVLEAALLDPAHGLSLSRHSLPVRVVEVP
jgi:hypothetical protein